MALRSFIATVALLALAACGDGRLPQLDLTGEAMGTTFKVSVVEAPDALDRDALEADILALLQRIDLLASTWREDSELSAFNADDSIDWIIVSPEFCAMLDSAFTVAHETGGAYDVTVGPLVNLWGFGPDGQTDEPPSDDAIRAAADSVGFDLIETDCAEGLVRKDDASMYVDLSGWAKGYAVDELAELLDDNGLDNYLVEVGGEVRVSGHNSETLDWAVAIEAPSTSERLPQAVLRITNTGVATSGDYRNFFEHSGRRYSHTIDPRTGYPVAHDLAAVTVVHQSTAYADAMATALLVLGPDDGPVLAAELDIAAYFLVRTDTEILEITSPAFDTLDTQ